MIKLSIQELTLISFILILNLLVLTFVKNRTTIITTIIVSHLLTILAYCMLIPNYQTLKEIIVTSIIYSTTILALVSNFSKNNYKYPIVAFPNNDLTTKMNYGLIIQKGLASSKNINLLIPTLLIIVLSISLTAASFYLIKTISHSSSLVRKKQNERQALINKNPLIFPGHPVHSHIKKYYLSKNSNNVMPESRETEAERLKQIYGENEKKRLKENILFKRSTDAILIIVGIVAALLLNYRHRSN